jgi:hypothetical protein
MCFQLALHPAKSQCGFTPIAAHVDPASLKRTGYDLARSLGDPDALWQAATDCGRRLELRCRSGHTLVISPMEE